MKPLFVIDKYTNSELKIKSSVFICHLQYADTVEKAKELITALSKQYNDATHNCWAYIIGKQAEILHSSDSGEPSGTAGKPILNSLQKHNLTNIVAVVTRYFGGTKLGVRGLIDAYSESTTAAIQNASLNKLVEIFKYEIITGYDFVDSLKYKLKNLAVEVKDIIYTDSVKLNILIEEPLNDQLISYLSEFEKRGKLTFENKSDDKPPEPVH